MEENPGKNPQKHEPRTSRCEVHSSRLVARLRRLWPVSAPAGQHGDKKAKGTVLYRLTLARVGCQQRCFGSAVQAPPTQFVSRAAASPCLSVVHTARGAGSWRTPDACILGLGRWGF